MRLTPTDCGIVFDTSSNMCTSKFYQGPKCKHAWVEIDTPCQKDRGFTTCPSISDGHIRDSAGFRATKAKEKSCPICDKGGDYDGNKIRIVKQTDHGWRWGLLGPGKRSVGVDIAYRSRSGLGLAKGSDGARFTRPKSSNAVDTACCLVM